MYKLPFTAFALPIEISPFHSSATFRSRVWERFIFSTEWCYLWVYDILLSIPTYIDKYLCKYIWFELSLILIEMLCLRSPLIYFAHTIVQYILQVIYFFRKDWRWDMQNTFRWSNDVLDLYIIVTTKWWTWISNCFARFLFYRSHFSVKTLIAINYRYWKY